jgi:type IV secretion system protein VirD4
MLLLALVFYLHYEAPEDEQNFPMVMEMIRAGEVKEDNDEYISPLDELFDHLETKNPEHIALKYYRSYHSGSGKTLKSIQITLISRLEKFNLDSLASSPPNDEMALWRLGEKKTAIFAVIPDNDSSFNFIVGMLYTQLFQQLYYQADIIHGGRLPIHVHFVMDEFANVALPDEFDKLLSTMRSREISVSMIIQNLAQLKHYFESSGSPSSLTATVLFISGETSTPPQYGLRGLARKQSTLTPMAKQRQKRQLFYQLAVNRP